MSKELSTAERWAEEDRQQLKRIVDLETENDRLEGIQLQAQELILRAEDWRDERDGYKARDKLRGEALELVASPPNDEEVGYNAANLRGLLALFRNEARAALAATPELTNG